MLALVSLSCIAGVLAAHQLQCCLPPLSTALQMRDFASRPPKVQFSQEGTPALPTQLLQAPEALQQVLPATPPGVAAWAAKWRRQPRCLPIKIGGVLLAYSRTLPPVQGADSSEEGTPCSTPPSTAAPLALHPPLQE